MAAVEDKEEIRIREVEEEEEAALDHSSMLKLRILSLAPMDALSPGSPASSAANKGTSPTSVQN